MNAAPAIQQDQITAAIARQDLACTLYAMRSWAKREGLWNDDLHGTAFNAKRIELERWNHGRK